MLSRLLDEHAHFLLGDFNTVLLADFAEQQAKTHAAFGDVAVIVLLVFDFLLRLLGIFIPGCFLLKLGPNLFEFGFDHLFRNREVMAGSKLVEKLTLHLGTGQTVGFLLKLAFQQFLQLVEAVEAERGREIVVQLGFAFDLHLFDGDGKLRVLTGKVFGRVIFGEGHGDGLLIAGLHARELLFKTGDELARTDNQRRVFSLAAFEFFTVNAADEIDDQLVAVLRLAGLRRIAVAFLLVGDVLQRFFNRFVLYRNAQALELQVLDFRRFDLGQNFQLDGELGVLAFFVTFFEVDRWLHRRAKRLFFHQAVNRFADHVIDGLRMQLFAMHFLDQIRRDLARTEARHFNLRRDLLDFSVDTAGDICGRNGHLIGALEAFVGGLFNLHGALLKPFQNLIFSSVAGGVLVRAKGLEPPHRKILVPKTSASTNSATPATRTKPRAHAFWARTSRARVRP